LLKRVLFVNLKKNRILFKKNRENTTLHLSWTVGIPLEATKPRIEDLTYLVGRVDKRLAGIANLLSYSSKLMVIKSVIAAMAIFAMSTVMVHFTILDHFEKSCRIFLWNKDIQKSGKCLVSWDSVLLVIFICIF
jgi:hypothetical protein